MDQAVASLGRPGRGLEGRVWAEVWDRVAVLCGWTSPWARDIVQMEMRAQDGSLGKVADHSPCSCVPGVGS